MSHLLGHDAHSNRMATSADVEAVVVEAVVVEAVHAPQLSAPAAVVLLRIFRSAATDERVQPIETPTEDQGRTSRVAS